MGPGFSYSVALGAFIAGSLVAESGEAETIERITRPVRDMFGAVFFVSVGMMIDPALVRARWTAVAAPTFVVIAGKLVAVSVGAFLAGNGVRTSVQAGMSLAQIGEFSFIIAGIGLAAGATRDFLYPVAVTVSDITTLTTPCLIRASGPVASWVERKLPHPVQTFATLYGSWIERIRFTPLRRRARGRIQRLSALVILDAVVMAALALGLAVDREPVAAWIERRTGVSDTTAALLVLTAGGAVALPFAVGLLRSVRALGLVLARLALPSEKKGAVDLAAAPRRALVVALQLGIAMVVGFPLLALAQPFLPPAQGPLVLVAVSAVLGVVFWQRATDLHEHTRAGAQAIAALLRDQMSPKAAPTAHGEPLAPAHRVLPGLGQPVVLRMEQGDFGAGRSLRELDLRGVTGATILSIVRNGAEVSLPAGADRLASGDLLAIAGSTDAVAAAVAYLRLGGARSSG